MGGSAIVGRELELGRIAEFLTSPRLGPRGLVIDGDPGSGKTRLWEQGLVAAATDPRVHLLTCRPTESERSLSFAALGDLLGGLLAEEGDQAPINLPASQRRALDVALGIEPVSDRPVDHRAVGAATLSVLIEWARGRQLVIAIDDLHWLDASSARAIGFAFRRLADEPVTMLATSRPERQTRLGREHVELIHDRRVESLSMTPLSLGAVERLLLQRLDLSLPRTALVQLHRTARGNPLWALELGQALIDTGSAPGPGDPLPISTDLQALLTARVQRLPDRARRALLLVALCTDPTDGTLAEAFGTGWDTALSRARQAGIVATTDGNVRFTHPLLATALVTDATERERADAHRRLAVVAADSEQRARHIALSLGAADSEVSAELELAAQRAARRGAPDAAAELAELSLRLTPASETVAECRRHTIAGEIRFTAGDTAAALQHLSEAEALAATPSERADVRLRVARVRYHHDDIAAASELLMQAATDGSGDDRLTAAIAHDLAYTCFASGELQLTLQHAAAAVEAAQRVGPGSEQVLADAMAQVAAAEFMLGRGVDEALLEQSRALEDWDHPRPVLLRPSVATAQIRGWSDRLDEARALNVGAEQQLAERGDDGSRPFLWYQRAEVEFLAGNWDLGLELAEAADQLAAQTEQDGMRALTSSALALFHAHLGRSDAARETAERGLATAASAGHAVGGARNLAVLASLALVDGQPDLAHSQFTSIVQGARSRGFDEPGMSWWLGDAIEAAAATGDVIAAGALVEWVDAKARAIDHHSGRACAARGRALLAAAGGSSDEALAACDAALGHHERSDRPFGRARTLLVQGQIARRARRWGVARTSLTEALDGFTSLGAETWAARTVDELGRVGGRRPATGGLTDGERQVAEMVAKGRTNREVAESLFLSPRTVSATLARVYRKLGVSSRTEMAAHLNSDGH